MTLGKLNLKTKFEKQSLKKGRKSKNKTGKMKWEKETEIKQEKASLKKETGKGN